MMLLHEVEREVAGDADRDGIAEGGGLADRETGNLGDDLVHGPAFPNRCAPLLL